MKIVWWWLVLFIVLSSLMLVVTTAGELRHEFDYFYEAELVEVDTEHRWLAPTGNDGPIKEIRYYRVVKSTTPTLRKGEVVTRWYPK